MYCKLNQIAARYTFCHNTQLSQFGVVFSWSTESHRAAPLCPLASPSQVLVWKHPSGKCGPAGVYSALHHIVCKFMLVKILNQIWMYRYNLPEINILSLMFISMVDLVWFGLVWKASLLPKWALLDQKDELASRANEVPSGTSTLNIEIVIGSSGTSTLKIKIVIGSSGTSLLKRIGRHINIKTEIVIGSSGNFKLKERRSTVA